MEDTDEEPIIQEKDNARLTDSHPNGQQTHHAIQIPDDHATHTKHFTSFTILHSRVHGIPP